MSLVGRIRSIKPEILDDEKAANLSDRAWRLWVSMWVIADDHGRLHANARRLHGQALWAKNDPECTEAALSELNDCGLIRTYQVNGEKYAEIPGWPSHQKVDNPGRPRVPTPEDEEQSRVYRESRESLDESLETLDQHPESLANDHRIIGPRIIGSSDHRTIVGPEPFETDSGPADPVILIFPTKGKKTEWHLKQSQIDDWSSLYSVAVLQECRKALAWVKASNDRMKTARGMARFLVGWLNRAQDSGAGRQKPQQKTPEEILFAPMTGGGSGLRARAEAYEQLFEQSGPVIDITGHIPQLKSGGDQ